MRFERRHEPILPASLFLRRLALSLGSGIGLVVASLTVGMAGYRELLGLSWIDAFLNASMILSGMGPVATPDSPGAKLFAGVYALYSGFAVLAIAGVAFGPVVHRFLHYLHADPDEAGPRRR
jgi:hypothetical protein